MMILAENNYQMNNFPLKPNQLGKSLVVFFSSLQFFLFCSCGLIQNKNPYPGPDKQGEGVIYGSGIGAGAGAVIANNLALSSGPGILIGAGAGALLGIIKGVGVDLLEEDEIRRTRELEQLKAMSWVQEVLGEHYQRRLELHPDRDIFPADMFFDSDEVTLKDDSKLLIWHLAKLTKHRMPWSRIVIAAYTTTNDPENSYAKHITEERARELAVYFVRAGIEPKRIMYRSVSLESPVLIDPKDYADRYRQAIEIIPLDF